MLRWILAGRHPPARIYERYSEAWWHSSPHPRCFSFRQVPCRWLQTVHPPLTRQHLLLHRLFSVHPHHFCGTVLLPHCHRVPASSGPSLQSKRKTGNNTLQNRIHLQSRSRSSWSLHCPAGYQTGTYQSVRPRMSCLRLHETHASAYTQVRQIYSGSHTEAAPRTGR